MNNRPPKFVPEMYKYNRQPWIAFGTGTVLLTWGYFAWWCNMNKTTYNHLVHVPPHRREEAIQNLEACGTSRDKVTGALARPTAGKV